MKRQGCSTLVSNEQGWILDRLRGLEKIISPSQISQALQASGKVNGRSCPLTHEVMLWVVLAMGLFTHLPIRQVFRHARRLRPDEKTPGRSNLCMARQRLGVEPVRWLFDSVVRPLATPHTPGAFYREWRLMAIDGTLQDVPDTPANAAAFGRSTGGRGDSAFPQVRKVSLVELGTHVETAFVKGGYHTGEQTLARQLFDKLPADSLLLEDRGFFSYDDWKTLKSRAKLLVRVKANLVLKPIERLADGSYLAKIYPSAGHRKKTSRALWCESWSTR